MQENINIKHTNIIQKEYRRKSKDLLLYFDIEWMLKVMSR